jgi:hypothetical protein
MTLALCVDCTPRYAANVALLSLGRHEFGLTELEEDHLIRVDAATGDTRSILERLSVITNQVLVESNENLRFTVYVPVGPGDSLDHVIALESVFDTVQSGDDLHLPDGSRLCASEVQAMYRPYLEPQCSLAPALRDWSAAGFAAAACSLVSSKIF